MRLSVDDLRKLVREEVEALDTAIMQSEPDEFQLSLEKPFEALDVSYVNIQKEKREFKKSFLAYHSEFKEMSARGDNPKEVRVGPIDPLTTLDSDMSKRLITDIGYKIKSTLLPGTPGSKSSMYTTYLVAKDDMSAHFSVVFGSANKGERFEAALHTDLVSGDGPFGEEFLSAIGLTRQDILSVEPLIPARGRPLTGKISDVGSAISDITLNTTSGTIYISLKDPRGGTFSNNGIAGMFVEDEMGIVYPSPHRLDGFVNALGIDKQRISQGVNDYKTTQLSSVEHCKEAQPKQFDAEMIANYLASALGYGYVYARKKTTGGYHVEYINTADDAKALVGRPTSVRIIYARYCGDARNQSSKGTRAIVSTDTGARYDVAIRNKSRGIIPKEIVISIKSYATNPESLLRKGQLYESIRHDIEELLRKQLK